MKVSNEPINKEDFNKWLEIFKNTSGRFTSDPIIYNDVVRVSYTFTDFEDYQRLNESFERATTEIVELNSSILKKITRKINGITKRIFK